MPRCRGCSADVFWFQAEGRWYCCDPERRSTDTCRACDTVIDLLGRVFHVGRLAEHEGHMGYRVHRCPRRQMLKTALGD